MMEDLPPFFKSLNSSRLISTAVTQGKLTEDDLLGHTYIREDRNKILIKDFYLGQKDHFKEVTILLSAFGILIDFVTTNPKYFQDAQVHFNTLSVARARVPLVYQGKTFQVKGKKINQFSLFNKNVHGTVMLSELFGCKIMTAFF